MTSVVASQHSDAKGRKRKAHKQSRRGCGNCKIRRVKCDEGRPGCEQCASFGVSCSYAPGAADLQPSQSSTFQSAGYGCLRFQNLSATAPRKSPCSLHDTILSMINSSQAAAFSPRPGGCDSIHSVAPPQCPYQLREHDLELLSIFQARTACSIGTVVMSPIYRREFVRLACQESLFHWYLGNTLFNTKLANPSQIDPRERDTIWVASVLLGAIMFSYVDSSHSEASWPLKPSTHLDPDCVFREALMGPVPGETDHDATSTPHNGAIEGYEPNVDDRRRFCFASSSQLLLRDKLTISIRHNIHPHPTPRIPPPAPLHHHHIPRPGPQPQPLSHSPHNPP
ncbi:hypothetical protein ACJ73_01300 [Blastomyces percursus]|uniref:Zn(2)-C6 fungal-type domain-containing protein n=1 Tax=Blastomyces percursus TaxID=1658174 RepID=A0A1J9R4L5_9EURO|nr:hypothetical protein ACJ73_01300 [Blastomyces percursus]